MSLDRLIEKIEKTQNPSVAGLDPKLAYVPEYIKEKCFEKYGETLKGAAKALLEFNKGLIDALYDIVPAVKPQAAYYEMYGPAGVKALYKTQEYARSKGMYVITDGKRNDRNSSHSKLWPKAAVNWASLPYVGHSSNSLPVGWADGHVSMADNGKLHETYYKETILFAGK